ncbi:MAG: hypothetical protein WED15_06470 [Akkermansiaceae bacterium]
MTTDNSIASLPHRLLLAACTLAACIIPSPAAHLSDRSDHRSLFQRSNRYQNDGNPDIISVAIPLGGAPNRFARIKAGVTP